MKVKRNRTLFCCDFCAKHRLTKSAMQRHELFCRHNPANKHRCFGCEFLVVEKEPVGIDEAGNLQRSGHQTFACAKRRCNMYSYVAERRKMLHKLGDVQRMPLQCADYEPEQYHNTQHPENPQEPAF